MRAHQQGNLGSALQHFAQHALVGFFRIIAERIEAQHIAQAFNQRGFAGAAATNEDIQVLIEVHRAIAQEAAFPGQSDKFRMRFGLRVAVQANP